MLGKPVEVAFVRPIDFVADNGKSRFPKVHPNLMLAPGLWARLQKREVLAITFEAIEHAELSASGFTLHPVDSNGNPHQPTALGNRRVDLELLASRGALANREVFLVHLPLRKRAHQLAGGLLLAATDQNAGSFSVESMKGKGGLRTVALPKQRHQRSAAITRGRMNWQSRRFGDDQDRSIPIQPLHECRRFGLVEDSPAHSKGQPRKYERGAFERAI